MDNAGLTVHFLWYSLKKLCITFSHHLCFLDIHPSVLKKTVYVHFPYNKSLVTKLVSSRLPDFGLVHFLPTCIYGP